MPPSAPQTQDTATALLTPASLSFKFGKALPWLLAGFGTIGVMIWLMRLEGTLADSWYYFFPPIVPAVIGLSILVRPLLIPAVTPDGNIGHPPLVDQVGASPAVDTSDDLLVLHNAKWWVRYPASSIFFAGAYYCAFEWRSGWLRQSCCL